MVVEVYLDDTLLQDVPSGVEDITEIIDRDMALRGIVVKYNEISLKFYGDGYIYIKEKIRQSQYEARITVKLMLKDAQGYVDTINAYFFTTDVEFNATENTFDVTLEDTNFGAFIKTGRKEKISPAVAKTKNGIEMSPAAPSAVTLFTPSTGVNLVPDAQMYNIKTVFYKVVEYLSDQKIDTDVSFVLGSDDYYFGLTKHYFIQTRGTAPDNQISFDDFMEFFYRAFGLMFWIDTASAVLPTLKLGTEDELMEDAGDIKWQFVKDLKATFDQDRFYSTVRLGSTKENIDQTGTFFSLPKTPLVGFGEEFVNARSETAIDNEFDISMDRFICGTNKIEELLTSTSYIEEHIIIQVTTATDDATKGLYGPTGADRYYNELLLNMNILARHNMPFQMVSEISTDTDGFRAYLSADSSLVSTNPIVFDDETTYGFDTGGNYNPATGQYTIPANGLYRFRAAIWIEVTELTIVFGMANSVTVEVSLRRNGTIFDTKDFVGIGLGLYELDHEFQGFFDATDTITVSTTVTFLTNAGSGSNTAVYRGQFQFVDEDGRMTIGGCNFSTVFVWNSGGAAITPDNLDYPAVLYNFNRGINLSEWKSLRSRPIQGITINTDGKNNTEAWVKKISRKWISGESTVDLFTRLSKNNIM